MFAREKRFAGACYSRAANREVGQTEGRQKMTCDARAAAKCSRLHLLAVSGGRAPSTTLFAHRDLPIGNKNSYLLRKDSSVQ